MKPRRSTNADITSDYGFHHNCHAKYRPALIRIPKQYDTKVSQYTSYELPTDKYHDSDKVSCSHRQSQNQNYVPKIYVNEARQEMYEPEIHICDSGPASSVHRLVDCYRDNNYYPAMEEPKKNKRIYFSVPIRSSDEKFNLLEGIVRDDKSSSCRSETVSMDWNDYHRLAVIYRFMDDLEYSFPSLCSTTIIGTSVEGRNLKLLKISNSDASNSGVWIDAGIHAREWIAPAVNTYLANHISRHFNDLPLSFRNKDWYFLPVVNPDGYEYSHCTDRMWRKNRAQYRGQPVGVDLNRNFSFGWGGRGSSDQPTNAFYRGPAPFSEPESSAIRDTLLNAGVNFKVYITLHSFGQVIIFPYACSSELAPDYVRLLEGATAMSKAIFNTNGNTYKVGVSRDVMYGAAGTSNDFAHGVAGIPYCYLIELRSKKHKFQLPKEEIEETGIEILNCVTALMEFVDSYVPNNITNDSNNVCSEGMLQKMKNLAIKRSKAMSSATNVGGKKPLKSVSSLSCRSSRRSIRKTTPAVSRNVIREDFVKKGDKPTSPRRNANLDMDCIEDNSYTFRRNGTRPSDLIAKNRNGDDIDVIYDMNKTSVNCKDCNTEICEPNDRWDPSSEEFDSD